MAWSSSEWSSVFFPLFLDEVRKLSDPRDPEQDCELKAAYRLLPRLKEEFPRLEVCLLLDDLPTDHELRAFLETPIQVRLDSS